MNWYKKAIKDAPQSFGWISIDASTDISKKMTEFCQGISKDDLYTDPNNKKDKYAIEDEHHATVIYGIHTLNANEVQDILDGQQGGKVNLDAIGIFDNDDYDVLKIDLKSAALKRLNTKLSNNLKTTNEYDGYNPHMTLAYLKKGKAKKYINDNFFKDMSFNFNQVIFEDANDDKTTIKLI